MSINLMISYPSERISEAKEIFLFLRSLDLTVWFDKESLVAGDDWNREINSALSEADLVIIVSSSETLVKVGVVQRELTRILELVRDRPIGSNFIVNMRAEDVSLPPELSKLQWIDLFRGDWRPALLRALLKKFTQLGRNPTAALSKAVDSMNSTATTTPHSLDRKVDNYEMSGSYFTYNMDGEYWSYINSEIVSAFYRSYFDATGSFRSYEEGRPLAWRLNVEEFFRSDDLISLRFFWFQDGGGAHPSYGTSTMNFIGSSHGRVPLSALFEYDEQVIQHIKKVCEADVRRQLLSIGHDDDISFDQFLIDADWWEVFNEYNFSNEGLLFNLSPYSVLPFVFGSWEVKIPWHWFLERIPKSLHNTPFFELVQRGSIERGW